jgi:hypothetical protein
MRPGARPARREPEWGLVSERSPCLWVPVEKTRQADAVPLLGMFTERGPIYFVVASEFFDLNRVRA